MKQSSKKMPESGAVKACKRMHKAFRLKEEAVRRAVVTRRRCDSVYDW